MIKELKDLNDLDGEIWKEICGYDGDYLISNLGRVKSFKKCRGIDVRILEPYENTRGYFYVNLYKNKKEEPKQIHTLMYETHIEKIPKGCVIHHIDFTTNNFMDNFEMMTKSEHNSIHKKGENHPNYGKHLSEETKKKQSEARKEKFKTGELNLKGENGPNHILTEQDVIQIRIDLDEGILTQKEIGEKFGVSKSTIFAIKNRKIWKHVR